MPGATSVAIACEATVALMGSLLQSNATKQQILGALDALCRITPPFFYQAVRARGSPAN